MAPLGIVCAFGPVWGAFSVMARASNVATSRYGLLLFVTWERNLNGEQNAEMVGTGPPARHGVWDRVGAEPAKFDGQYRGEPTLTKVIKGDCTQPPLGALYPLRISRGEVRFVYVPRFDTALSGRVVEDGTFKASARARKGFVQMTGRIQGNNITATIVSPSCNYSFQTKD